MSHSKLGLIGAFVLSIGASPAFAAVSYLQGTSTTPQTPQSSVAVSYPSAQQAGSLNVVAIAWADTSHTITSVTDTHGNAYVLAIGPTTRPAAGSQSIYYAANSLPGSNQVTVTFNAAVAYPDVRIVEYSGIDALNPLDVAVGASGFGTSSNSGVISTLNANDLLIGANYVNSNSTGPGSGFTQRMITNDGSIFEDRVVTTAGSYSAAAAIQSGDWIMQMVAFRAAGSGAPDTIPPSAPSGLTTSAISSTQINVSWTASTDNVGVTGYELERCQGAGCSNFALLTSVTGTSFNNTGLTASTSYSYRVRARDAVPNFSAYSSTANATTSAGADTTPPSTPTGLTTSVISSTQINVSWTASTDDVAVTGYELERCQGAGCSNFALLTTVTGTSFNNTGLTASTSYSYRVRARDAVPNFSGYSSTASATTSAAPDTTPPSAPSGLTTSVISSTQINVSWTASTDNVAVTGYELERCQGAGCSNFALLTSVTGTSFNNTGLTASTAYSYRVRARDAVPNFSGYSSTASATTLASTPAAITYLQGTSATPQTPQSSVALTYPSAQQAGSLNVVAIAWADTSHTITSVTDTHGNAYVRAIGPTTRQPVGSQSIYYAVNSLPGSNQVTVTFNAAVAYPDVRIVEYSGIDALNPLDVAVGASGHGTSSNSGVISTLNANDLLIGANYVNSNSTGPGSGFTQRMITNDGSIVEDRVVTAVGSYSAVAALQSGDWIMQMVAFRAGGGDSGPPDTTPPSAPSALTTSVISSTQINVSWTASTDDVGVTGYQVERCTGAGCSNFALVTTVTGTSFNNTGLTASTSYSYRVRANDAIPNFSAYSSTASATTSAAPDTTPPSAPSGLTTSVISSAQINLSWTASTDDVGVTGYQVERCTGAGCSNFALLTTVTGTSFNNTGLTASTSYSYRVRANDVVPNFSAYSNTASATTSAAPDTTPPSTPSGLTTSVISSTQINVSWTASTDDVGVTGYELERCQGSGCSNFVLLTTVTGTSVNNTGLTASTSYSYRVRARDAVPNFSGYSSTASATTSAAPDTTPPSAPSGLTTSVISSTQINVSWTASTDNVAVTGYELERCQGAGCSSFALLTTVTGTSFNDTGLTASTAYSYRVRARDAVPNFSGYSSTASATTLASTPAAITYLQGTSATPQTPQSSVALSYLVAQQAGTLNVVAIAWSDVTSTVTSVTDTHGNVYLRAIGPTTRPAAGSQSIYYAVNSLPGSNQVTVTFNAAVAYPDVRIVEYSGIDLANPLDVAVGASGQGTSSNSGSISTLNANDLLIGANYVNSNSTGPGSGFTQRMITNDGSIFEDRVVTAVGSYSAAAALQSGDWVMQMVAFRAGGGGSGPPDTTPPSSPSGLTTSVISSTQINVSWTASTDDVAVAGYQVERCTGVGCSNFALLTTMSPTSFNNTGLTASTSYSYRVRATDAAGNLSAYSNTASATTTATGGDTTPPSTPTGLTTSVISSTQINVSWTASTDNVAVTGYELERCQGSGCSNFALLTTVTGTSFNNTGLTPSTSYSYRVRARDAAPNFSGYSTPASATTLSSADTTPPSISLTAPGSGATITGNMSLVASASDAGGIDAVQFVIDGIAIGNPIRSTPYSLTFASAQLANGSHSVTAYAWDTSGNIGTAAAVGVTFNNASPGNPLQTGLWSGLFSWPLVAIHMSLMSDGRVMTWDRMNTGNPDPQVYDPVTGALTSKPIPGGWNLFCAGHTTLADGRLFVVGGHIADDVGLNIGRMFNPATNTWTSTPNMSYGRWYPTATNLPDGRVLVMSGEVDCYQCYATVHEIYNPATNTWSTLSAAAFPWPWYPHTYVLPDGRVLVAATTEQAVTSRVLDLTTNAWTVVDNRVLDAHSSAMYLPGKILKTGTATPSFPQLPSAATAYVLDMTQPSPQTWRTVSSMAFPRAYHVETLLPDGTVLITGGGRTTGDVDVGNAVYQAELWSPTTETFTTLSSMHAPRLYHGTALLLPDGRVLVSGGGRSSGFDQLTAEVFTPPYLFKGARPTITSAPGQIVHNQAFTVQTPNPSDIAKVTLVGLGSMTHGFNMGQRYLPLTFSVSGADTLTVTAPANANLAPPGTYMLFVVNSAGVPSVAAMMHF